MSVKQGFFSAVGLALLTLGIQLPTQAQSLSKPDVSTASSEAYPAPLNEVVPYELTADALMAEPQATEAPVLADETLAVELEAVAPEAETAELSYPETEETEIAQRRRRTRRNAPSAPAFIGIGADLGTADDVTFAVISKLALGQQLAIRPSVLIGEDFAVLVPVTYEFSRFNTDAGQFQIRPYAGAGASYVDEDDSSELGLLLTGGVDIPISERFTANAQANYAGIFSDSENFGVTLGVGYNFGGLGL